MRAGDLRPGGPQCDLAVGDVQGELACQTIYDVQCEPSEASGDLVNHAKQKTQCCVKRDVLMHLMSANRLQSCARCTLANELESRAISTM